MMTEQIKLGHHDLLLYPQRAAFLPSHQTLLVADVHLGKDQVFRRQGVAVPAGVLAADLKRLSELILTTGCERLIVLGDWVHAPPRADDVWPDDIKTWRKKHQALSLELVEGNHDRSLAGWLDDWGMRVHGESLDLDGLLLIHAWQQTLAGPGISGHLHPGASMRAGHERVRLPAFLKAGQHLVLPAFGRFTGLMDCPDFPVEQCWAVAGNRVFFLPRKKRS